MDLIAQLQEQLAAKDRQIERMQSTSSENDFDMIPGESDTHRFSVRQVLSSGDNSVKLVSHGFEQTSV